MIALTILKGEGIVGIRCRGMGGGVRDGIDFDVLHLAVAVERQGQREQGSGRLHLGAGDGVVAQRESKGVPQHLVGIHAWALVSSRGVGQQDEGLRRGVRNVQIIAQGVGTAAEQEGVFLVGVKTGLGGVILHIDTARLLGGAQIPGADPGGDHELRRIGGILNRVAADHRGQVERGELIAWRDHFLEPPDGQLVTAGPSVDRNNRTFFRCLHADREGIEITRGVIIVTAGDVTSHRVAGGRLDAGSDFGGGRKVEDTVGILVVDGGDRRGGGERAGAVRIRQGRAAEQALRLDIDRHIPGHAARSELEQGAASLICGSAEVGQQSLCGHIQRNFGLGRIVLENHRRRFCRVEDRPDRNPAAEIGHRDGLIVVQARGPDLGVFGGNLRPADIHARGGGRGEKVDGQILRLQPEDVDVVRVGIGALRMINQRAVGQGGGAVEWLAGVAGVGHDGGP